MISQNIGFIGSGNMAEALIGGLIAKGTATKDTIFSSNPSQGRLDFMKEKHGITTFGGAGSNLKIVEKCKIVVLAVKPHLLDGVLQEIKSMIDSSYLLISVAAGYTIERMESHLGADKRIARTMPNTPSLVGAGCGAYSVNQSCVKEDSETVKLFMDSVGISFELKEHLLDAVSGLSGSGPSYVFMFIEALADGGVK